LFDILLWNAIELFVRVLKSILLKGLRATNVFWVITAGYTLPTLKRFKTSTTYEDVQLKNYTPTKHPA